MNVAISTFVRRGHLLAALAVAVLLAASSGTAWAQVSFSRSTGTVEEGASNDAATPVPLKVTIRRTGNLGTTDDPFEAGQNHIKVEMEYKGVRLTSADAAFSVSARSISVDNGATVSPNGQIGFADSGRDDSRGNDIVDSQIELTITAAQDNQDWLPDKLVLTLMAGDDIPDSVRFTPRSFTVTITDDEPTPKFKFSNADIQLAKGNMQDVTVGVGVGTRGAASLPADMQTKLESLSTASDNVLLSVGPADAVGRLITITKGDAALQPDGQGRYNIGMISDAVSENGIELTITARDVSGFRDETISLMLMDGRTEAQKTGDGGPIDDADPATVKILSAEETPTVTFSTEAIDIDEGDSATVHLLADTDQGSQVGSATVRVSGDALISLSQGGSAISGGTVSFGGSANAELTITALMDRELEDGEEKTATVTITDASGANIGDPRAVTVTVVGATAVPALPLIAQLLLALFLMAGGARLYRRRQG